MSERNQFLENAIKTKVQLLTFEEQLPEIKVLHALLDRKMEIVANLNFPNNPPKQSLQTSNQRFSSKSRWELKSNGWSRLPNHWLPDHEFWRKQIWVTSYNRFRNCWFCTRITLQRRGELGHTAENLRNLQKTVETVRRIQQSALIITPFSQQYPLIFQHVTWQEHWRVYKKINWYENNNDISDYQFEPFCNIYVDELIKNGPTGNCRHPTGNIEMRKFSQVVHAFNLVVPKVPRTMKWKY